MMHGGEGMEYWRLNNNGEGGGVSEALVFAISGGGGVGINRC